MIIKRGGGVLRAGGKPLTIGWGDDWNSGEGARNGSWESAIWKVGDNTTQGAANQQFVAEGWCRGKQAGKRRDELEDDCLRAPVATRRGRLEEGRVVLVGRRRQAHEVVVGGRRGERRRGSP